MGVTASIGRLTFEYERALVVVVPPFVTRPFARVDGSDEVVAYDSPRGPWLVVDHRWDAAPCAPCRVEFWRPGLRGEAHVLGLIVIAESAIISPAARPATLEELLASVVSAV